MAGNFITGKLLCCSMCYVIIVLVGTEESAANPHNGGGISEIGEAINVLTRKCASLGFYASIPVSEPTSSQCRSIPLENTDSPFLTMPMTEMLVAGVKEMDNQKASLDQDGIFPNSKAIFVLGNTGSGKTTATQIMAGDLNRLHASFTQTGRKLVIIDDDDRIGAPTTQSRTLVPEYVIHPESGLAFWDCPGFNDNRGPEVDIAAMYFMKHALDSTRSAKFLLTVTHSSVQPGNDRLDFDLLATRVARLFSNVTKLQPAIGLVVTKVGGYSAASGKYLSDEKILLQIQEFLGKYVETITHDMQRCDDNTEKIELENKINLVEGILGTGTVEKKLHFLRSPETCGVLGEMHTIQDTQTKLAEMIGRLKYVDVTPQDFRPSVKAETRLILETEWIPENTEKISEIISSSGMQIWTEFENKFYSKLANNAKESISLLNHTTDILDSFLEHSGRSAENESSKHVNFSVPESISEQLHHMYINLSLEVNCAELAALRQLENQRNFFQLVTKWNEEVVINWTQPFSVLHNELVNLQSFYEFCQKTDSNLSSYSNQVMLGNLLEQMRIPQFGNDEADVLEFLLSYNFTAVSPSVFTLWGKMGWMDRNHLTKIVTKAVPNVSWKCAKSISRNDKMRLTITGNFLKLSDVITSNKWPLNCNEDNVAEISIVALEIIYLDTDVNHTGREWDISIISPTWQVVLGENETIRNILLDGVQPADPEPLKVADGANYGNKGKNGEAGLPGGNAGSFFGIYARADGINSLFISANGGNGGKGQDGGNGHIGKSGRNAAFTDFPSIHSTEKPANLLVGYIENGNLINSRRRHLWRRKYEWNTILGGNGTIGSDGGNGGNGGTPGNPGKIQVIAVAGSQIGISSSSQVGLPGIPGTGGLGAKGGRDGDYCSCSPGRFSSSLVGSSWNGCYKDVIGTYAKSGNDGQPGKSLLHPAAPASITPEPWRAILEYKTSFFENPFQRNFLKILDTNEVIQSYFKTVYFAKEIEFIENKFYQMLNTPKSQETFLDYYHSLLNRLNLYTKSLNSSVLADEEKYAISLLQAIVTGKIVGMRRGENRLNVLDTEGYFATLAAQLIALKTEEQEKIISEERSRFKATLDAKVQEAEKFIEHTVQPAIAEAQKEMDKLNDELLQELHQFQTEAEVEAERRKEAKRQFESLMWLRPLMGILKTAGTLCSFLGPTGAIVGGVINVGASTIGDFAPQVNPYYQGRGRNIVPEAANQLHSISGANRAYYTDKINNIQRQVDMVVKEAQMVNDNSMASTLNDAAQNTIVKLSAFKHALTSPDGSVNEISMLQYEMATDQASQNMLGTTKQVADAQGEIQDAGKKTMRNEQRLRNVAITLQAGQALQGTVTSIMDNQSELEKLTALVKEAEQNVKNLNNLRDKFYEELFPEIDNMNQAIQHVTERLPGESNAALSVKKWKAKRVLKMVRGYLQQFTNGFKTQEKFQLSFDELDEALVLLIDMYDHIERYAEKKQLAEYIANVNLLIGNKNNIQDEELKLTLERLEFNVEANLFYQEYQRAMHAFKQWVFPFASNYLEIDSTWETGKVQTNLTQLIQVYSRQIQTLEIELKRYKTTTVKGDDVLMLTTFTSGLDSSKPFYVWQHADWKHSIKKLLNGEVVHLKADVDIIRQNTPMKHFFFGKSAIKFKTIKINIKAHNESRQVELNRKLNHFHMKMTHSGISVYKVMGKKYVMFDKKQSLEYSFEETTKGYVTKSMSRHKTDSKNADYLMSPYTWWTLQIDPVSKLSLFKTLAEFSENVDLELVGEGIYLNELKASGETLEKLDLTNYYDELFEGDEFVPTNILDEDNCVSVI